ncbi:hypothetical protein OPT61_g1088 [Boeremia exigua]|uniref:Uncharacterized protein n=1 Tax=Boeremia exigua TaxID=749465 RepID=A0ACC2IRI2_9PLEO|nr:hypothetical protein OPT61_g1088 [Boeremia exigua]
MAGLVQIPDYLKSYVNWQRIKPRQTKHSDTTELSDLIAQDTDDESPEPSPDSESRYNSMIYGSISTNSYIAFVVSEAFLDSENCVNCTSDPDYEYVNIVLPMLWDKSRQGLLDHLNPTECFNAYATSIQSSGRNVLVVIDNKDADKSLSKSPLNDTNVYGKSFFSAYLGTDASEASTSYSWICGGYNASETPCANKVDAIRSASQAWQVRVFACSGSTCEHYSLPVKYCLSEPAEPKCKLRFSPIIAIIVTVLNFVKAVLMFSTYATVHDPILTMGDAVVSFLRKKDLATADVGLLNPKDLKTDYHPGTRPWHGKRWRWKDTTSRGRRTAILSLFLTLISAVMAFLIWGVETIRNSSATSVAAIFRLGFGALDSRALLASDGLSSNIVALVLLSNTPQVLLSLLYFAYNGLFTAMLMGYEWASYAHKQKGLRVSGRPSGMQRSTYFLQLPYRFSIPLTAISGVLHWSVSQSIFVVSFDLYDFYGMVEDFDHYPESYGPVHPITKTCGYSPSAMLLTLVLGFVMVLALVGLGYMPYKSDMPLAGSCSSAISATCHPVQQSEAEDRALAEEKLQWGVVSTSPDDIGHCAFSSIRIRCRGSLLSTSLGVPFMMLYLHIKQKSSTLCAPELLQVWPMAPGVDILNSLIDS